MNIQSIYFLFKMWYNIIIIKDIPCPLSWLEVPHIQTSSQLGGMVELVYGTGLENQRTGKYTFQEFKSLSHRQESFAYIINYSLHLRYGVQYSLIRSGHHTGPNNLLKFVDLATLFRATPTSNEKFAMTLNVANEYGKFFERRLRSGDLSKLHFVSLV